MPFLDHLEELRWRILKSLLGVAIAFVFTFWLCTASGLDVIGIATKPIQQYMVEGKHLVYTNPIEPFTLLLQAAGVLAVVLAFPVVGYQVWAFLSPALSKSERKVLIPVLIAATLLFLAVWWVWVYTSWITNWLNPELTPVRMLLFLLMLFPGLALWLPAQMN